ncbi:MAG: thiamine pyrophosphate-dependent dehydrogenase E1 component subunit alpha [Microcella sp.]|uniref:thiamine pyrophosphate-dependent dehydrogenase E1 component subunit alpha n=1 Tax=Microcella sp. TaxID=1913979 RepID=UPI0033156257
MSTTEARTLTDGVPADAADLLRRMWEIRHFENEVMSLFSKNLVRGSTHLCQGQEAVSVGVCWDLRHSDQMTCTYRGHGAVLAKGAPLDGSFGEILGREIGLCGGKGGSMHLTDLSVGALGSNAIVGAHLPISVGSALSAQVQGRDDVSVAIFGDGSTNIGAFHESLNMASIWKLPVVFVIENNQYGEYSPIASTTPIPQLVRRADAYGMPGVLVDGNDVVAVRAVMHDAVARARRGEGPTLIEASTYRQAGHSRSDPGAYRPEGELEHWLTLDPIPRLADAMVSFGVATRELVSDIETSAHADVLAALDRALASPTPDNSLRSKDVFA